MFQEEAFRVFDWFRIYFIENEGMAWELRFPEVWVTTTLLRLVAVTGIGYVMEEH